MFLRRFTQHFKEQNWIAAFVDFLIVVTGIFIGLQVNGWNETRIARNEEAQFIQQLHSDIGSIEAMQRRLLGRRLSYGAQLNSANDVLFGRTDRSGLTEDECVSIYASNLLYVPVPDVGSFNELIATGRVSIIRDSQLRVALIDFQQIAEASRRQIDNSAFVTRSIEFNFPELIQIQTFIDETGEVRIDARCDVAAMKENQAFLNNFARNTDLFDGYLRGALKPWSDKLREIHTRVDETLGETHAEAAGAS